MLEDNAQCDQWLAAANSYANQERWGKAVEAFREALKIEPHNLNVRGDIISLSLEMGNYSEVIDQHMECAEIFRQQDDFDAADDRYWEALALEGRFESQSMPRRSADEIAQINEAVQRAKSEVCLEVGRFFLRCGEAERAVQYLRKSTELGPERWESHMSLGHAYMQIGLDREAIEQFQEVSRLEPEEAGRAYEMTGEIFARRAGLRYFAQKRAAFKQAVEIYLSRGLLEDATRIVLRYLDFEPECPKILRWLAELYAEQGRLSEAVETYRVLLGLYPDNKPLDEVIGLYETVLSWDPNARWAVDALIDLYESVLEREPNDENVRDRLKKLLTKICAPD